MTTATNTLKQPTTLPDLFREAVSKEALSELRAYLAQQGPTATVFLVLRVTEQASDNLRSVDPGSYWLYEQLDTSFRARAKAVQAEWQSHVGADSPWRSLLEFRKMHVCGLRGPTSSLRRFFDSPFCCSVDSPIAGVVRPFPIRIPEQAIDFQVFDGLDSAFLQQVESVDRLFRAIPMNDEVQFSERLLQLLDRPHVLAALDFYQRVVRFIPWLRNSYLANSVRQVLTQLGPNGCYLNELGIGDVHRYGESAGEGQKIILLDSGADESLPFLQQKVSDYIRLDGTSQFKKAHDCVDAACHGTKMATVIAGRSLKLRDIGLTDEYVGDLLFQPLSDFGLEESIHVRPGIAPGAKLAIAEVLHGDVFMETGGAAELVAGLDWAAAQSMAGCQILNMSIECDPAVVSRVDRRTIDGLIDLAKLYKIVPIVAAGNRGEESAPISEEAMVVGAARRDGTPFPNNGPIAHLLAPGENILCGQPRLLKLRNMLAAVHSGSSFATAVTSGCVALLAHRFSVPAFTAANALLETSNGGMLSLDKAAASLEGTEAETPVES
ncbi:MAG: S8/S53 family peptidase [Pirellulaceae bacterium]